MCGIFGYVGQPADLGRDLTAALKTLEYRGYDSWGIAVGSGEHILVEKQIGQINGWHPTFPASTIGFGHTRWATHGGVTRANAHPHLDASGRIAVIHNGIIENDQVLRTELVARGHQFQSETDSEIVAHLIAEQVASGSDLVPALARVFDRLRGFNAVIAMDICTGEMVATKCVSPLVAGVGAHGVTIASDALALQPHADRVLYLDDSHLIRLGHDGLSLYERHSLRAVQPALALIDRRHQDAGLGAHPHFMAKEIAEQPVVLDRLAGDTTGAVAELAAAIAKAESTLLVGCGSAGYAAATGAYQLDRITRGRVTSIVGSEFKYHQHLLSPSTLVIALSQSGETADLIEAAMLARQAGARLAAIVNVEHSTLDRMVDLRLPLGAGPEQCVLATKSFLAKLAALTLTAYAVRGEQREGQLLVKQIAAATGAMLETGLSDQVRDTACHIVNQDHLFVIGRGLSYPTSMEAALKIKEASYVHAEAFAGGELKHGVIALIESGTPCLVFAPNDDTRADILSGATEIKSRGGFIIGVGPESSPVFDVHFQAPDLGPDAAPLVNVVPAQLLGYHLAVLRGVNPDRPRNLAKSVTVK